MRDLLLDISWISAKRANFIDNLKTKKKRKEEEEGRSYNGPWGCVCDFSASKHGGNYFQTDRPSSVRSIFSSEGILIAGSIARLELFSRLREGYFVGNANPPPFLFLARASPYPPSLLHPSNLSILFARLALPTFFSPLEQRARDNSWGFRRKGGILSLRVREREGCRRDTFSSRGASLGRENPRLLSLPPSLVVQSACVIARRKIVPGK